MKTHDGSELATARSAWVVAENSDVVDSRVEDRLGKSRRRREWYLSSSLHYFFPRFFAQALNNFVRFAVSVTTVQSLCDVVKIAGSLAGSIGHEAQSCSGVRDQASNKGLGLPGVGVVVDRSTACGLTKYGDTIRISTKTSNIPVHPFNSHALIEKGHILRKTRCSGKAEDVESIAGIG